jgi:hypothetical protein
MRRALKTRLDRLAPTGPARVIVVAGFSQEDLDEKMNAAQAASSPRDLIVGLRKFSVWPDEVATQ